MSPAALAKALQDPILLRTIASSCLFICSITGCQARSAPFRTSRSEGYPRHALTAPQITPLRACRQHYPHLLAQSSAQMHDRRISRHHQVQRADQPSELINITCRFGPPVHPPPAHARRRFRRCNLRSASKSTHNRSAAITANSRRTPASAAPDAFAEFRRAS